MIGASECSMAALDLIELVLPSLPLVTSIAVTGWRMSGLLSFAHGLVDLVLIVPTLPLVFAGFVFF